MEGGEEEREKRKSICTYVMVKKWLKMQYITIS